MTDVHPAGLAGAVQDLLRRGWSDLRRLLGCAAWLALVGLVGPQTARAGALPGELPSFAGQLSALQGDVRWYDRDSAGWLGTPQQPLRNWPLAAGDRLRTGADGRAELRVGNTTVRLGADVDLTLQRLDEQGLVLSLQAGTLALRLSDAGPGGGGAAEVITREGRWLPRQPGHYRFDRQPDATQATVWRGELRFEGPDSALTVSAGRRADLWRDAAGGPTRYAWAPVERDGFADWVARDERLDDAPATASRVPPGVTGWQDLDRHGDWIDHPEYGQVWQPREVASGWAPYQDGRWAWVAPWGWTWIDAAPWGFAPFHYGSWVVWQGRWCWSPGPREHRARYAPALSAWVVGPSLGVGGHVGGRPPPPRVVAPVVMPPHRFTPPPPVVVPRPHFEPERPREVGPRDAPGREGRPPVPDRHDGPPGPARPHGDGAEARLPQRFDADGRDRDRRGAGQPAPNRGVTVLPAVPAVGPAPGPAPAVVPGPATGPVPAPGPGGAGNRPDPGGPRARMPAPSTPPASPPATPPVTSPATPPSPRPADPPARVAPAPGPKPAEAAPRPAGRPESREARDERAAEPQRGDASQRHERADRADRRSP